MPGSSCLISLALSFALAACSTPAPQTTLSVADVPPAAAIARADTQPPPVGYFGRSSLLPLASVRLFGETPFRAPDCDGDGIEDVLIGEPGEAGEWPYGKAYLLSGRTGRPIACWIQAAQPSAPMQGIGAIMWFGGDVDGDRADDLVLTQAEHGKVWILSADSRIPRFELKIPPNFCSVALLPLHNSQGSLDKLLVGAYSGSPGTLHAFSLSGERIATITVPIINSLSACMSVGPDTTGDGIDDIVVSGPELTATLISGGDLRVVRQLHAPAGQTAPALARLAKDDANAPLLSWIFPTTGAAIWTHLTSPVPLAIEELSPWEFDDGQQPRPRGLSPGSQKAFLLEANATMLAPQSQRPKDNVAVSLASGNLWASPSGPIWGAGETEIWRASRHQTGKTIQSAPSLIVDPFLCQMLDVPQRSTDGQAQAPTEMIAVLGRLTVLLRKKNLRALGELADPVLGMKLWTTTGSVAQPTHVIHLGGKVVATREVAPTREAMLQHWLPTVAGLVEFGLAQLKIDEPWIGDPHRPSAMLRTQGHARAELAHELRSQTNDVQAANEALSTAIEAQLVVMNYDQLRIYLSVREKSVAIAHIILDESEADDPEMQAVDSSN